MIRKLICFALFTIYLTTLAGCLQSAKQPLQAKPEDILRVGVSTNSPPLIFLEGGKVSGLEADLARSLADYLGRDVRFIKVPWEKQIDYLVDGKTDIIMSGMTVTDKRAYRVAFSDPYLKSGQLLLSRLEDKSSFNNGIYSLMNPDKTIGTVKNTVGDYLVTKTINKPKRIQFNTSKQAVSALKKKEVDVVVYDAPMACHYAAMNEQANLTVHLNLLSNENLAWAVAKQDQVLLDSTNVFLSEMKKSGELKRVINKWVPYL